MCSGQGRTRPSAFQAGQLDKRVPSETAQAWDSVRRVREPLAWTLLVVMAIAVLVSAWQLFGLPGTSVPSPVPVTVRSSAPVRSCAPVPTGPSSVAVTTFGLRASAVAPQFVTGGIVTLTVASVILVAFAGGPTERARQVVQAAVSILAVALGLGVVKRRLGPRPLLGNGTVSPHPAEAPTLLLSRPRSRRGRPWRGQRRPSCA